MHTYQRLITEAPEKTSNLAMKHTFISHASKDVDTARAIKDMLEARGVACWMAPEDITPGRDYAEEILRGIETTACTILLLSESANESPFVKREIERAVSKKKPVFPVRLDNTLPAPALELFVSSAHWIDASKGNLNTPVELLAASIQQLIGAPTTTPPTEAKHPAAVPPSHSNRWKLPALFGLALITGVGLANYYRPGPSAPEPATIPAIKPLPAAPTAQSTPAPTPASTQATVSTPTPTASARTASAPSSRPAVRADHMPARPTPSGSSKQCSDLLQKISLGEPLTPSELSHLKSQCQ